MYTEIDARGKACPIPVIMAKKEVDTGNRKFMILVDNKTAVENLSRFGKNNNFDVSVSENEGIGFSIEFTKEGKDSESMPKDEDNETKPAATSAVARSWAVFMGKEGIGHGDPELSEILTKMYFFTLKEGTDIPKYILFMNDGVKVTTSDGQVIDHLKELSKRGTEILVCGACLNFYELTDLLKVGTISNMYDITEAMNNVDKVITI